MRYSILIKFISQALRERLCSLVKSRVKMGSKDKIRSQFLLLILTGFYLLLLTGLSPGFPSLSTHNFGDNLCQTI